MGIPSAPDRIVHWGWEMTYGKLKRGIGCKCLFVYLFMRMRTLQKLGGGGERCGTVNDAQTCLATPWQNMFPFIDKCSSV